jgi:hypothetical protein
MTEGIDPFEERDEEAGLLASEEQTGPDSELHKLTVSDDSMLTLRQRPDRGRRLPILHRSGHPSRTAST